MRERFKSDDVVRQYRDGLDEDFSELTSLRCADPSLTVQSSAEEADINTIVKRFGITGQLPQNVRVPTYADFEDNIDYRTAIDSINLAKASFMQMPADVRARFGNDPAFFVDFCSDSKNLDEMRKLGLAVAEKPPIKEAPPPEPVKAQS